MSELRKKSEELKGGPRPDGTNLGTRVNAVARLHEHATKSNLRDWSLITGRGGLQNGKNRGSETFCAPPLKTGLNFLRPPLLKSGNF